MEKKELTHPVDSARRAILFGGVSLVASALLVGCHGDGTKPAASGSRYVGIDGRDYRIAPPPAEVAGRARYLHKYSRR